MIKIIQLIAALLVLFSVDAYAAKHEPGLVGVLDAVYLKDNAVVVDDRYYKLTLNVKIVDASNKTFSRFGLKQGKKVRYLLDAKRNRRAIEKLVVLPDSYVIPDDSEQEE
ncbi:MAG: hypothetical protein COA42_20190 [Alteromonadaceae bacterium]|nr:MAG: hypothetical protein COA42_20190 [Alteromonadaceae bacterium]